MSVYGKSALLINTALSYTIAPASVGCHHWNWLKIRPNTFQVVLYQCLAEVKQIWREKIKTGMCTRPDTEPPPLEQGAPEMQPAKLVNIACKRWLSLTGAAHE